MNNDVQQRVLKAIAEVLERKETEIRLDASLRDDLAFDSLKQMTLFILLEDEFQRTITPDEVMGVVTVKDIIGFIDRKLQEPAPPSTPPDGADAAGPRDPPPPVHVGAGSCRFLSRKSMMSLTVTIPIKLSGGMVR